MKWNIFERQEEDMATKKVETKTRSANPRASAATTKATAKPTAKATTKATVKSSAQPSEKSKTAKSTVAKTVPKAKGQPANKAKAQPATESKVQPAKKAKAESASKATASSKTPPMAKTSQALSKPQETSALEVAVQAEKPVITSKQSAPKKVIVSITFEQIAQRAYEMWEQRGYSHGNDVDDWCRAEAELLNNK